MTKNNKEKAKHLFEEGITLLKGNPSIKTLQINFKGILKVKEALELDPKLYTAYPAMFSFYWSLDGIDELNSLLIDWKKNFPKDPNPYFNRGKLLHRQGKIQESIKEVENGIKLFSENDKISNKEQAGAYFFVGMVSKQLGQMRKSIDALKKAKQLDDTDLEIRYQLAVSYATYNKNHEALDELSAIGKKGDPRKFPKLFYLTAEILLATGNKKYAREQFISFISACENYDIAEMDERDYELMLDRAKKMKNELEGAKDGVKIGDFEINW